MNLPETALFRVLNWMESHLDEELSLEQAAVVACYSPYHFNRLFKRFTGEDFGGYTKRLRLETGAFLLKTGLPVTQTALCSGYWTHEAFTRAFRAQFGRPPKQFAQTAGQGALSDRLLERPQRARFESVKGFRLRKIGAYESISPPGTPGNPWPQDALRRFGISWDDPDITPTDKIRYDVVWTGSPQLGAQPIVLEGGAYLTALHKGRWDELTESYRYLLYAAPKLWSLQVHPTRPPFEEFGDPGIRLWVPLSHTGI